MNKTALEQAISWRLEKIAGTRTDVVLGAPASMIPYAGPIANLTGTITGLSSGMTMDDVKKLNNLTALAPGVAPHRMAAIPKAVGRDYAKRTGKKSKWLHEYLNSQLMLNPLILGASGAALGSGIGALAGDVESGAAIGGGAGLSAAALGNLVGMITAASTKTRDQKAQDEAEKGSRAAQYLIPGKATHDYWKRLGYAYGQQPGG